MRRDQRPALDQMALIFQPFMHENARDGKIPPFKSDLQLYCPPVSMESEALTIPLCFSRSKAAVDGKATCSTAAYI